VGNTPTRVPQPTADEKAEVTIRLRGYRESEVELSATSPEVVTVALARHSRRPRVPSSSMMRPSGSLMTSIGQSHSDVVDPWE